MTELAPVILELPYARSEIHFGPLAEAPLLAGDKGPAAGSLSRWVLVVDTRLGEGLVQAATTWMDRHQRPWEVCRVPGGEDLKSLRGWQRLVDTFHQQRLDRDSVVVALGGGTVGDTAGFAASNWQRGIPWVALPTTLVAAVDAMVGGKTALNHCGVKNQLGAFHLPVRVHVDVGPLGTLPVRELRSGWGEIIKTAIVGAPELFEALEGGAFEATSAPPLAVIRRCVEVKARVVAADYRDQGLRGVLNLGHTLAHALEADGTGVSHGEAVGVGLAFAARLAADLDVAPLALVQRVDWALARLDLPRRWRPEQARALLSSIERDKKQRGGVLRMALPRALGDVALVAVPYERLAARLGRGFD